MPGNIARSNIQSVTRITFAPVGQSDDGIVPVGDPYDLVVIGGGSAGLTAADFAARIGAKVLIAAEELGGDCTWTGCIPSKALIRIARVATDQRHAGSSGIGAGEVKVDFPRVMAEVRAVIARVHSHETREVLAQRGIEVAIGRVRFAKGDTIEVGDRPVAAKHFIVCTGAEPVTPSIPGLVEVPHLTYESIFDLNRLPASIAVIGAGSTGVELAQALARLGSTVTVIDQSSAVLPDADPEAAAALQRRLESDGVELRMAAAVTAVSQAERQVVVHVGGSQLKADALLVATGRRPRITGLELEHAGIEVRNGAVSVDKNLRTTNPRVYAAGDVTGGFQFTHYAGWQGYVAARNALLPGAEDGVRATVPWAVFTDPEIAQAGLSEAQARAQLTGVRVHRLELDQVDRAQTEGELRGFVKLIADAKGKLVGASVVSKVAGETINELALAIERGLTVSDLASTIHVYPTFGFAVQKVAADAALEAATSGARGRVTRSLRRLS
jgi:pyruvate/2-oxoglutarate dehydrogenase complex dihydrolipoamide dehydrogenase (E3) component